MRNTHAAVVLNSMEGEVLVDQGFQRAIEAPGEANFLLERILEMGLTADPGRAGFSQRQSVPPPPPPEKRSPFLETTLLRCLLGCLRRGAGGF